MKITQSWLSGIKIIEPDVFRDPRGWFIESWSYRKLAELAITEDFVQDNHSFSQKAGTLRGLHFQRRPHPQAKIIRCTRGKILDVAVDIRKGSPTYREWVAVELSAENFKQMYVPAGFAHGFLTLTDNVEIQYKASDYYAPECDRSIRWNDPDIGVEWGIDNPVISDKDLAAPLLCASDNNFRWECQA